MRLFEKRMNVRRGMLFHVLFVVLISVEEALHHSDVLNYILNYLLDNFCLQNPGMNLTRLHYWNIIP